MRARERVSFESESARKIWAESEMRLDARIAAFKLWADVTSAESHACQI